MLGPCTNITKTKSIPKSNVRRPRNFEKSSHTHLVYGTTFYSNFLTPKIGNALTYGNTLAILKNSLRKSYNTKYVVLKGVDFEHITV